MLFDLLNTCGILLLEMLFVFVSLALLHSQRRRLGTAPFCMVLGMLFVFAQFIVAADFQMQLSDEIIFRLGPSVLFAPIFAAFLIVYITEGTLAAQQIIIGMLAIYGIFLYLAQMTQLEYSWGTLRAENSAVGMTLSEILNLSVKSMLWLLAVNLINLFLLPITYTKLLEWRCRRFFAIFAALGIVQMLDLTGWSIADKLISSVDWSHILWTEIAVRLGLTFIISILVDVYAAKIEEDAADDRRGALDIFFAFFGSYARAQQLEARLRDQENRHRLILDNATDAVILLTADGVVVDNNQAAARLFRHFIPGFAAADSLFKQLRSEDGKELFRPPVKAPEGDRVLRFSARLGDCHMDCSLSQVSIQNEQLLLLLARDNTEARKLQQEKERLSSELEHSQRLESLGQLAGGIAHDFNNNLHAILGHVDLALMSPGAENPDTARHLDKIAGIAEQSGRLTSQLLGFARKGKFLETELDLRTVINESIELLPPVKQQCIDVRMNLPDEPMTIRGDAMQLKQAFMNLFLNAADAMGQNRDNCILEIAGGPAQHAPVELHPPPQLKFTGPEQYFFVMVKDNGSGVPEEFVQRIFEPFFTTKPVGQGTGMGLPMVYGTIAGHHGFIQLESKVGSGSAFYVFLPRK